MVSEVPDPIHIDVDYYDEKHRELLSHDPRVERIDEIVRNGLEIPLAEFLTYFMFHRRENGATYRRIIRTARRAKAWLEGLIDLDNGTIEKSASVERLPNEYLEHMGESVGLSVVSSIYDLTEADWNRIPESSAHGRLFDYSRDVATDGEHVVQIETKGSYADNATLKGGAVSHHRKSIEDKKADINAREAKGIYRYPADRRYGTITTIGPAGSGNARCWLLDPDPDSAEFPPEKMRLVNRLRYLRAWFSLISPRSSLAIALANRIADIEVAPDIAPYAGQPLRDAYGEPMVLRTYYEGHRERPSFFASKSVVSDGPAGGVVVQTSADWFFFLGIREDLLRLAVNQDFAEIQSYRAEVGTIKKTVSCTFSRTRFEGLRLSEEIQRRAEKRGSYFSFSLDGFLNYSRGGLVFGMLRDAQR